MEQCRSFGFWCIETIGGEVVNVALPTFSRCSLQTDHFLFGINVSELATPIEKASSLSLVAALRISQAAATQ